MSTVCPLCKEPVTDLNPFDARPIGGPDGPETAHRECLLRMALGGIGHLEDHQFWCSQMHDPDGGRSYRQSALEVDAWVQAHGLSD